MDNIRFLVREENRLQQKQEVRRTQFFEIPEKQGLAELGARVKAIRIRRGR